MSSPTRILVIDDDPRIRDVLSRFLSQNGFEVDTAVDGETGLRLLQEATPDIVLLDMDMPGINGLDVLRHVMRDEIDVKVVAISGHPLGEELMGPESLRLGAVDYIAKPFDLEALRGRLTALQT